MTRPVLRRQTRTFGQVLRSGAARSVSPQGQRRLTMTQVLGLSKTLYPSIPQPGGGSKRQLGFPMNFKVHPGENKGANERMNYVPWSRKRQVGQPLRVMSFPGKVVSRRPGLPMRGVASPTGTHYPTKPYSYLDITLETLPARQLPRERMRPDHGAEVSRAANGLPAPHLQSLPTSSVLELSLGTTSGLPPM